MFTNNCTFNFNQSVHVCAKDFCRFNLDVVFFFDRILGVNKPFTFICKFRLMRQFQTDWQIWITILSFNCKRIPFDFEWTCS